MKIVSAAVWALVCFLSATLDAEDDLVGVETWGGRKAHPAIVNPVLGDEPGSVISLAGEWDFITQPWRHNFWVSRPDKGLLAPAAAKDPLWKDARKLRVPGVWEDQGVGTNGVSKCWDCAWDGGVRKVRHFFSGCGVYRREVKIPAEWKGSRIWLKTGWAFAAACFWVNGEQVAMDWNYCATYKYDITDLVKPGETALVTAEVSNAFPSLRGNFASHNRYGGLYRAPELEATPSTLIDDAWVRGDFDKRCAQVKVKVEGQGEGLKLRATVDGEMAEIPVPSSTSTCDLNLALRAFRPWSPEHPNLYTARVELVAADGTVLQVRRERFGVRKFEVRGKDIFLNDAPYFIRGVGFHNLEPIHGVRPADRAYIRRQLEGVKAAGFNAMRLHTRCESPEFFETADELGLLVQPELPYYGDAPCENFGFDPMREVRELYTHFRRHPSFAFYSLGNEGTFGTYLDRKIHQWVKATDPDRIKLNQDIEWGWDKYCGKDVSELTCAPPKAWSVDAYDPDRPFICHEYLNLAVKANPRLGDRYTGQWEPPYTLEDRKAWLAKRGLTMFWGDRLQRAQHILQRQWRKQGIEMARADRWCDGYWFWSYFDSTTKTGDAFSAQSLFDPFGNPKPYGDTAETFAVFNSPSGVFAFFTNDCRVAAAGETVRVGLRAAHFGEADLADARAEWRVTAGGRVLASGTLPLGTLTRGGGRDIGAVSFAVPALEESVAAELSVAVTAGTVRFANGWRLYLMARREVPALEGVAVSAQLMPKLAGRYHGLLAESELARAKTLVAAANETNLIERALASGKRVVSIAPVKGVPNVKLGWWWMGSQVGTALADHPFLRFLPHDGALDPLLFRIIGEGRPLPFAGMDERDMAIVGEGKNDCYLYLGEMRRGGGLVVVEGLDVLADLPEANALLDGILLDEADCGLGEMGRLATDAARLIDDGVALPAGDAVTDGQGVIRQSYVRNGQSLHVFRLSRPASGGSFVRMTLRDIPGALTDGWQGNEVAWVDMRTGRVRRIDRKNVTVGNGRTTLADVPLNGSPVLIARNSSLPFHFDWKSATPREIVDSLYLTGQYGNPMKNFPAACTNEPWLKMKTSEFLPCFDRFGQFKHRDWPGKVSEDAELTAAAEEERKDLAEFPGPRDRDRFGGWKNGPKLPATGRFYVKKVDGKWWFVDPEGNLFWSFGPVRVSASSAMTPLNGDNSAPRLGFERPDRDCFFEGLPPAEGSPLSRFWTTHDDLLWPFYVKRGETRVFDFSGANLYRKYGEGYADRFADLAHRRLRSWGFNTIANGSDLRICLMDRTPYAERIETRSRTIAGSHGPWGGFRDPWDESFASGLRAQLAAHGREAHDPWCIGFFVDNEINWGLRASDLARWTLLSPADQPAKAELVAWLRRKYGSIERMNEIWGSSYGGWADLADVRSNPGERAEEDLAAFTRVIVGEYFRRTRETLKAFDKDLLYLGCRFYACPDWVADACARNCDVVSWNVYRRTVDGWMPSKGVDKPVLIGEFHFGTRGPRAFGTGVVSVATEDEQAERLKDYVRSALRNPCVVGAHWHQYSDQAASGRFDGEGLQVGLTDICDRPYPHLRAAVREVGSNLYDMRFSPTVIVLPDTATPVEKSAAAELADGLKRVTGASPAVVAESQAPSGTRLYVGATKASRALRPNRDWKMDEVLVDNVADGIVLDGHSERAPIYAVDSYLERELGVRWWTSKAATYPKREAPVTKVTRYSHASPFRFRETYFLDAFDPDFKVRSKINYTSVCRYEFDRNRRIPKEKGGDYTLYFFKGRGSAYHSAFEVLPPSKYFEKHPDWYSFVRGKRQPKQLCCTNREMLDEYIRVTKELLRASPGCNFIQCSQNDDWDPCWCENCSAVKEAEGGAHGANNLRMANAVAEAIEEEFPDVWVDTFAYQYTRKAPKLTRPRRNLLVRLCSVECGFNRPISDPAFELNAKFARDLEEWSKVGAGHLFIWDYTVDFTSYMLPHPTILNFADNIRTFAKSGAVGLFEQGDATCSAGEFAPLRFYLLSKLAWDPSLDADRLMDEFLAGYYGSKAAPLLREYLVHMHAAAKAGPPMTLFHTKISPWIGPEAFLKGAALMDAAYAAAQTENAAFAERVCREKMSVDHAFIVEWDVWKTWADKHKADWPRPASRRAAVEEWIAACRELGIRSYRETNDPALLDAYFEQMTVSTKGRKE